MHLSYDTAQARSRIQSRQCIEKPASGSEDVGAPTRLRDLAVREKENVKHEHHDAAERQSGEQNGREQSEQSRGSRSRIDDTVSGTAEHSVAKLECSERDKFLRGIKNVRKMRCGTKTALSLVLMPQLPVYRRGHKKIVAN